MNYLYIQRRLHELGYDPGPLDGIRGRRSINAVMQFQRDRKLDPDGLVGPKTLAAMFPKVLPKVLTAFDRTPWIDVGRRIQGAHEVADKSRLMAWLRSDGATLGDPARNPWCGDFVQTALAIALPHEPLPDNPYWARAWADWGIKCPPVYGSVAVFERGRGGHVAFVIMRDPANKRLLCLGGNQSNSVKEAWVSESRLLATRWPITALPHSGKVKTASSDGAAISTNEG